jgi:hypothetical protein
MELIATFFTIPHFAAAILARCPAQLRVLGEAGLQE